MSDEQRSSGQPEGNPVESNPGESTAAKGAAAKGAEDRVDLARAALARARATARSRPADAGGTRGGSGGRSGGGRRGWSPDERRSGSGPDDRDPQPMRAAISRLLAEHGWETDAAVAGVLGRWETLVGPDVAAHCRPESFADGVLTVHTDSTAWATQIRLLAPTLLRRLNTELGHGTVTRVQVRGPQAPSWSRGRRGVRDGRGPRDTYG